MDADDFNKTLESKASELGDPNNIPSVDVTLPEIKLDLIALEFAAIEHGGRIKSLENTLAALTVLVFGIYCVLWLMRIKLNVGFA